MKKMNKEEMFAIVKGLTDKLEQSKTTGTIKFDSIEEKRQIEYIYKDIYPYVQLNLGCADCVKQYLYFLQTWYEREYPIYLESIKPISSALDAEAAPKLSLPVQSNRRRKKIK